MKIKSFVLTALAIAATSAAGVASAATFQNSSGLTAPAFVQSFDTPAVADDSAAGSQFSGMTFSSGIKVTTAFADVWSTGQAITNFYPCCTTPSFVDFSNVLTDVGFLFVTNPGTSVFSAYLDNVLVESFSAATDTSNPNRYFGFTGIAFNQLRFDSGGDGNAFILDNMQYNVAAPIPEPETYAMLLAGLGLMVTVARRRRARTGNR